MIADLFQFRFSSERVIASYLPNLDRIIRGLLYVYIFALPFHRLLFIERNGFLILLALLVLWCGINRQHFFHRTAVDWPLLALIGWVGVSTPFAASPEYSIKELGKLLQQGLVFYVVVHFLHNERDRWRMLYLLIASLAGISLYGLWQFDTRPWMGAGHPEGREYHLIPSVLSSEIWLTTYLIILIPLCVAVAIYAQEKWQRLAAAYTTIIAILCQALTFSRAGLLALFAEGILIVVLLRRRAVTILVLTLAAVLIVASLLLVTLDRKQSLPFLPGSAKLTTYNLEARLKVWRFGLSKVVEHPLVGIGYGKDNFYLVTKEDPVRIATDQEEVPMPSGLHNTFLDITVGAGLPAGFAYLWLMGTILYHGWIKYRNAQQPLDRIWLFAVLVAVAGLFVRNGFEHMWLGAMALLFWVMVGLSLGPMRSQPHGSGLEEPIATETRPRI